MERTDEWIRDYLKEKRLQKLGGREKPGWPDADDFYRYLTEELRGGELERMLGYLAANAWAQELVIEAREQWARGASEKKAPEDLVRAAKSLIGALGRPAGRNIPAAPCPHCGKLITPFKKPPEALRWNALWLAGAVASFALSFVFKKYFIQWLVVTLVCAFRWTLERRALKTQILIYKALSDTERDRLHQHSSRL